MARRNRTAEILAAANLVPSEIAREQEQTRRQSATSQALASLVPALIQGGAGIAGDVLATQKADARQAKLDERDERDYLADIANRKATTDAQKARADAMKVKAEADKAKAANEAAEATRKADEAARPQKLAGAAADVESEISMPGGVSQAQLEQIAVSRGLPVTEWRTVLNERDANVDRINKEALEIRKDTADAFAAERKPTGPKSLTPEQIEEKELRRRKLKAEVDLLEGKPAAAAEAAAKAAAPTPLPPEMAKERALKIQGLNTIPKLRELKKSVGTGPVEGRFKDALGYVVENPERKQLALLSMIVQRTAGKILEGGKLAEGDAKVYQKFLNDPTNMDDDEFNLVIDTVEEFLRDDLATFDAEMKSANRQVGPRDAQPAPEPVAAGAPVKAISEMTDEELAARRAQLKGAK